MGSHPRLDPEPTFDGKGLTDLLSSFWRSLAGPADSN